jgi:hypothetical protein
MSGFNGARSLLAVVLFANGPLLQDRDAGQQVNLGQLESTGVSVSSVNGKREQNNPYYGARNLVDGGRNVIDGINYTSWLSDQDAFHWIRMKFRGPVDIQSIMVELPARVDPPRNVSESEPTTTASASQRRPQEVALDVTYGDLDGKRRVEKLPSTWLAGFRAYYPLEKPLAGVVELTLVFPGRSMVEVSEVEVMGTLR